MKNKIYALGLIGIFVLILVLACVHADEWRMPTGNEIVPLVRGDNPGILMDPNKMYTLYYVADGKPAVIQYSESFGSYFFGKRNNENSLIAMSIYHAPWFNQKYSLVKNTQIWFLTEKTNLPQKNGVYKFEFKCYGHNWCAVNFKVNW